MLRPLIQQRTDPGHTIRTISDRRREITEHPPRVMQPRTPVGIGQHSTHSRRQPAQVRQFPQHPNPGMCHHTRTISADLEPRRTHKNLATLHLESASSHRQWDLRKNHYPLRDRHFRYINPRVGETARIFQANASTACYDAPVHLLPDCAVGGV
jgi:hypothetical protein